MGSQWSAKVLAQETQQQQQQREERKQQQCEETVLKSPNSDLVSWQVHLARRMAERQMAMQVATVRELMSWFVPFVMTSYTFLILGYRKTNSSWVVMFPLLPISFGLCYQFHYAYGNKTNKIKELAERIMANETNMMAVPEWQMAGDDNNNNNNTTHIHTSTQQQSTKTT
ncbi:hypothetical protein Pmani_017551 [Petrolisthes manimaculis]|uniref:Plasminogen receptor (KT) n=1 Tax=Petrolisthes manimaculis TaxID=1843537 RepID=A0AAE1PP79_9EUCA|nr:hypothetical protein Pmani_017551 [Petrolisthes manimaculis]